ncbi:MAG: HAD family phosphatase [Rikenellaceae bacterium]
MLSSIKNIIFDIGGVLIDLDRERCVDSFTRAGFPEADNLIDFYHPAEFFQRLERGEIDADELCDIIRANYSFCGANEQICEAYCDFLDQIPLFKLKMLESLKARGFRLYALSNVNAIVMPKVRKLFEADGKSIDEYFEKTYLSFEMGCLKPDDIIYQKLIDDSGIVPSETLFIDDSQHNIDAGAKFGLQLYLAKAHEDYCHIFETLNVE